MIGVEWFWGIAKFYALVFCVGTHIEITEAIEDWPRKLPKAKVVKQ